MLIKNICSAINLPFFGPILPSNRLFLLLKVCRYTIILYPEKYMDGRTNLPIRNWRSKNEICDPPSHSQSKNVKEREQSKNKMRI